MLSFVLSYQQEHQSFCTWAAMASIIRYRHTNIQQQETQANGRITDGQQGAV